MLDSSPPDPRFWAVVPAAGIGARMGGERPKQYLLLAGRPIIVHTLARLCNHPRISGVVVAIAAGDEWWTSMMETQSTFARAPMAVTGGRTRRDSVLCGLEALSAHASPGDWVLVHDAVRPCLTDTDLDRLMDTLAADAVGGLLAVPVRDTMKRANGDDRVCETVDREALWHAQTPQMFRLGALRDALEKSVEADREVTDEAQAMELTGTRPRLVPGHEENIKITRPDDLELAEVILARHESAS